MKITAIKPEQWRDTLGDYYADHGRVYGPSISVKLNGLYEKMRKLEDHFDLEDIGEAEGSDFMFDIIESEMEYYREWIDNANKEPESLLGDCAGLEAFRFTLAGRSGGHLVYNVANVHDHILTPEEFKALTNLWEKVPSIIDSLEWNIAQELAGRALATKRERKANAKVAKLERKIRLDIARDDFDSALKRFFKREKWLGTTDLYDAIGDAEMAVATITSEKEKVSA